MNRLYFGDNWEWLADRREFPDASVDLVYLDPPFNSNADYNVLFRETSGQASQAQFHAFTDTWSWADAAETYHQFIDTCPNVAVVEMMEAFHSFLKNSPMMAYLAMMAPRLVELHRVLKETGSLYLHCDPTASHYLRTLLDGLFDARNFRTEIIWKRSSAHSDARQGRKQHGRIHDSIFFYTKSNEWTWNHLFTEYDEKYVESFYKFVEPGSVLRMRHHHSRGAETRTQMDRHRCHLSRDQFDQAPAARRVRRRNRVRRKGTTHRSRRRASARRERQVPIPALGALLGPRAAA